MAVLYAPQANFAISSTDTSTSTRLMGHQLLFWRGLWGVVALISAALFIYAVPIYYGTLRTMPLTEAPKFLDPVQLFAEDMSTLREDIRIFRLDRIQQVRMLETPFTPPEGFDALRHLQTAIATIPHMWRVEVLLKTTFEDAQARVSPNMALLEAVEDGVMMRCYAGDLDWMARFLVGLRCRLTVIEPAELRDELRKLAGFIMEIAGEI